MGYGDLSVGVQFDKDWTSPFSYHCAACNNCCKGKAIRVGPYEILLLARLFQQTTTEFIKTHTQSGGTILRTNAQGDCGFLGPNGCTVHNARPLACRLYPLGLVIEPDGTEKFGELAPHPASAGQYGGIGTVACYVEQQGALPYIAANEIYEELYNFLVAALADIAPEELANRQKNRNEADSLGIGTLVSLWTDIDATLSEKYPGLIADDTSNEVTLKYHVREIKRLVALIVQEYQSTS